VIALINRRANALYMFKEVVKQRVEDVYIINNVGTQERWPTIESAVCRHTALSTIWSKQKQLLNQYQVPMKHETWHIFMTTKQSSSIRAS